MMNYYAIQQNSVYAAYGDMGREYVVCPKPRRAGISKSAARQSGWRMSHQADIYESNIRNELLDIILFEDDDIDSEQTYDLLPSTSPFFSGSPPSRVPNPLIQDARFSEEHNVFLTCSTHVKHPTNQIFNSGFSSNYSPSSVKSGFPSAIVVNTPSVRVEGFNVLSKDRRSSNIAALA